MVENALTQQKLSSEFVKRLQLVDSTILFADIAGTAELFTQLPPEDAIVLLYDYLDIMTQAIMDHQRQGRISYGALKRRFQLDDAYLEDLKVELIEAQQLAHDENGRILVGAGETASHGSPRGLTPPTCKRRRPCWRIWREDA